jgi:hypothetical protein
MAAPWAISNLAMLRAMGLVFNALLKAQKRARFPRGLKASVQGQLG